MTMREDTAYYHATIIRYAEALLHSKLSALEAELEELSVSSKKPLPDRSRPLEVSAQPFVSFAKDFTELSRLLYENQSEPIRVRHHCARIIEYFREQNVSIERVRRAPSIIGDEHKQLACIRTFCEHLDTPTHARFRTRDSRFIMTLIWDDALPEDITHIIHAQHPEQLLIKHLSEGRLSTFIRLLSCQQAGLTVRCQKITTKRLAFSWVRARQLQIQLHPDSQPST